MDSIVIVHDEEDFEQVNNSTREMIIPNEACNTGGVHSLNLVNMTSLERIVIGEDAMRSVASVDIRDISKLVSIQIGSNSFSSNVRVHSLVNNPFRIVNCSALRELVIGANAFSGYSVILLSNLPSLTRLVFKEGCFPVVETIDLLELPLLEEVETGDVSDVSQLSRITEWFVNSCSPIRVINNMTRLSIQENHYNTWGSFCMNGFPVLSEVTVGANCFMNAMEMNLKNCSSLESLLVGSSSFYNVRNASLSNLPSLESISVGQDGLFFGGESGFLELNALPSLRNITSVGNTFQGVNHLIVERAFMIGL